MTEKTCIVIVGPTAVGKTSLSIRLAKLLNTDIISADSRQCYRELNIGVAKPSPSILQEVKHYFIDSHSIFQEVNAALFEQYALASVEEIFRKQNTAIMVGGTGLYVQAFCEGMDEIPVVLPEVRNEIRLGFEKNGLAWLQQQIQQHDPAYFEKGETLNPSRLMRSLEVKMSTGHSILSFHSDKKKKRDFAVKKIGLHLPRELLYQHINQRVDDMIAEGFIAEVQGLFPSRHLNALNTVGYKELFAYLEGKLSKDEAIDTIKKNTRHYAKRQLTWFKKDDSVKWFFPGEMEAIALYAFGIG